MLKEVYYHFIDNLGFKPSAADIVRYLRIARSHKTTEATVRKLACKYGLELSTVSSYPRSVAC